MMISRQTKKGGRRYVTHLVYCANVGDLSRARVGMQNCAPVGSSPISGGTSVSVERCEHELCSPSTASNTIKRDTPLHVGIQFRESNSPDFCHPQAYLEYRSDRRARVLHMYNGQEFICPGPRYNVPQVAVLTSAHQFSTPAMTCCGPVVIEQPWYTCASPSKTCYITLHYQNSIPRLYFIPLPRMCFRMSTISSSTQHAVNTYKNLPSSNLIGPPTFVLNCFPAIHPRRANVVVLTRTANLWLIFLQFIQETRRDFLIFSRLQHNQRTYYKAMSQ